MTQGSAVPQRRRVLPLDGREWELLRIFEQALESRALGVTDDFFASGGDSLAAARVFAGVAERFNVDAPLTTLLEAPTVQQLAFWLRARGCFVVHRPLVVLNPGRGSSDPFASPRVVDPSSPPPLFFAPGAGADAFMLHELGKAFSAHQPVIGLSYPGLDGKTRFKQRVGSLAKHFEPHVRAVQRHGPYFLAGSSFGGMVVLELARRLERAGEHVALIVLLDSYGPGYPHRQPGPRAAFRAAVRWFMPRENPDAPATRELLRQGARFRRKLLAAQLQLLLHPRRPQPSRKKRHLQLREACLVARRRYVHVPYAGEVLLFRGTVQPPAAIYRPDPWLGWRGVLTGDVRIVDYPGGHDDYLRSPTADVISRTIEARMIALRSRREPRPTPAASESETSLA